MATLGLVLGALVGLSLGLLGGGGSILTVPIFVYVLGFEAKPAIAMSLAVVGATSLFGSIGHWHAGNVNARLALTFGAVTMVGTYLGARLAAYVSGAVQLTIFAFVMLAASLFMFRDRSSGDASAEGGMPGVLVLGEGMAVGLLTGLVGVGGGFLIVPALVVLGRVSMKRAVGTSLLVIAMNSFAGFVGYVGQVEVAWGFMAQFTAVAIAGILAGTYLAQFVSQRALRRAFAVFLLVIGAAILYQNREVLLPQSASEPAATVGHLATGVTP